MYKIPIVYEDNHMLVVDKPPNLLSQKDSSGDIDLLTLLKEDLKIRYNKPGNVYLGLVHRLDRPVGGVMVLAKTSKCAARLSEQLRNRDFNKTYIALIYGRPNKPKSTLVHYLIKDEKRNRVFSVQKGLPGAKEAILDYEVLACNSNLSLVKVNLLTGRPHQIRVQFATLGHPLYGDYRYGPKKQRQNLPLGLWACEVSCLHPITKERMNFYSLPTNQEPWSKFPLPSLLKHLSKQ